ncbi:MAG: alpha/beta fold hydrolase [Thiotrichales bacterium]|nr:alpha/beta fold hydrolase [Thiotrichales bacterium]
MTRSPDQEAPIGSTPVARMESLLAAVDGVVRDAHVQPRFGGLGAAFSAALGSWIEPFAVALREVVPTAHSQDAARAVADLARLCGEGAGQAMRSMVGADPSAGVAGAGAGPDYDALAGSIDDAFRGFSSTPEFDRVRRAAAAAVLDWLERDPAAASEIARALDSPPPFGRDALGGSMPPAKPVLRDGNVTLTAFPAAGQSRASVLASVLVVPGFAADSRLFDLDPERSVVRTLARHGVEAWRLDWGRGDETDRRRTVADQLERIDRVVDAMREAANGRPPALAGHFHGGLLALLYCLRYPGKAGALVTVSTPVRFTADDDGFAGWLRACDGERIVDVFGNVPGPLVATLAAASSPMHWCGGGFFTLLGDPDAAAAARIARFEEARRFPPAFPGETFRGLYRALYRDDAFAAGGGAVIDGHRYVLARLDTPLLNVFAREDRIVPPGASTPLAAWAGAAPESNRAHPGGHHDLLIGGSAHAELLPGIAAWLVAQARRG